MFRSLIRDRMFRFGVAVAVVAVALVVWAGVASATDVDVVASGRCDGTVAAHVTNRSGTTIVSYSVVLGPAAYFKGPFGPLADGASAADVTFIHASGEKSVSLSGVVLANGATAKIHGGPISWQGDCPVASTVPTTVPPPKPPAPGDSIVPPGMCVWGPTQRIVACDFKVPEAPPASDVPPSADAPPSTDAPPVDDTTTATPTTTDAPRATTTRPAPPATLVVTGGDATGPALLGLGLALAGIVAVVVSARRRAAR